MHRLMMNTQAYRQTSRIDAARLELDPQNRLLSRMSLRRMNAEALRDSLLFVADRLEDATGGPPDPVSVDQDGLVSVIPTPSSRWRRSVYLQYRRTEIPSLMDTFDYPEMGPNCLSRNVSTVAPQALMLMNNKHVRKLAAALAERVLCDSDATTLEEQIERVYQVALSRSPSAAELRLGIDTLQELEAEWQGDSQLALESYCHAILNSAGFLYVD